MIRLDLSLQFVSILSLPFWIIADLRTTAIVKVVLMADLSEKDRSDVTCVEMR